MTRPHPTKTTKPRQRLRRKGPTLTEVNLDWMRSRVERLGSLEGASAGLGVARQHLHRNLKEGRAVVSRYLDKLILSGEVSAEELLADWLKRARKMAGKKSR